MIKIIYLLIPYVFLSCGIRTDTEAKHLQAVEQQSTQQGVTKEQFEIVINEIVDSYKPIAKEFGAELSNRSDWDDPSVDAWAGVHGNQWHVDIYGGLGRHKLMTPAALAVVTCHEIGHLFGGFPAYSVINGSPCMAHDGQSDYFAAQACLRKIWHTQTEDNQKFGSNAPYLVSSNCDAIWQNKDDADLCRRIALAALDWETFDATTHNMKIPAFDTPDPTVVEQTFSSWPNPQCRLDTFLAGALCDIAWNDHIIPGMQDQNGPDSLNAERISLQYTCSETNHSFGQRSKCWFKQRIKYPENKF